MGISDDPILKVRTFGVFEVLRDGIPISSSEWPRKKVETLFKIFCSERGRVFTQDQLIEFLFPELNPGKAAQNLYNRISELRKVLEPNRARGKKSQFIDRVSTGDYCLRTDAPCWIDLEDFNLRIEEAIELESSQHWLQANEAYHEAIELYQGELFSEDLYEDWSMSTRESCKERYLMALEGKAHCHSELAEYRWAIDGYQKVLQAAPTREHAIRQLMLMHVFAGESEQALQTFEIGTASLKELLEADPSDETRELYERIKEGGIEQPQKASRHNLPQSSSVFVGRIDELQEIDRLLNDPAFRLVTLIGPGGIGKTRLALQLASERKSEFNDGVFWVDLVPIASVELIPIAIANAMKLSLIGQVDPSEQVLDFLSEKNILLILDNFEHLIEGIGLLDEISARASNVQLIVTSRERLMLRGEAIFEIEGMKLPEDEDSIPQSEAIQLGLNCLQRVSSNIQRDPEMMQQLARICRLVLGVPLAIELAIAWARILPLSEIAQEIEASDALLSSEDADLPERHRSMQAVFEYSWKLLSEAERQVFMRLSVFRGGFTRTSAQEVVNANLTQLSLLLDKSLINSDYTGRYELHELLRQYGEEKLHIRKAAEEWQESHVDFFLTLAEEAESERIGPRQEEWLNNLEVEHDNFRAALQRSTRKQRGEQAIRLASALGWFWNIHSHFQEGLSWLETALAQSEYVSEELRAKALLQAGTLSVYQSSYEKAQSHFEASLMLNRAIGSQAGIADALNGLGLSTHLRGDYESARSIHEECLDIRKKIGDERGLAETYNNLGMVFHFKGDLERAFELHSQSLALRREIEDKRGTCRSLGNLGNILLDQGEIEQAEQHYSDCLKLSRQLGDQRSVAVTQGNLGRLSQKRKRYTEARAHYDEKLKLARTMNDRSGVASTLNNLATPILHD